MYRFYFFIVVLFFNNLQSQNFITNDNQLWNYGNLNINTSTKWKTNRLKPESGYYNIGIATFVNGILPLNISSESSSWVDGYIKHLATSESTSHVYPVGSDLHRMFLSTSNEKVSYNINVAWIEGNPSNIDDLTSPNTGKHPVTNFLYPINSVSDIGQWDWISDYPGSVVVNVKLPSTLIGGNIINNTRLRLVGWDGDKWINLGSSGSSSQGVLSGDVSSNITSLAIGSLDVISNFNRANIIPDIFQKAETNISHSIDYNPENYFQIYPNPSFNGLFIIKCNTNQHDTGTIYIYDNLGKKVFSKEKVTLEGNIEVDAQHLPIGIYTLSIINNNSQEIDYKKIIIKN